MKFVVAYVLVMVGMCLWAMRGLLRNEEQQIRFGAQFGNKGTTRMLLVIAILAGLFWPVILTVRVFTAVVPSRWFFTKDDDDDELPSPNQEQGA